MRMVSYAVGVVAAWGAFCSAATAVDLFVDRGSTNPVAPFASLSTAATNISAAVTAASPGDRILIAAGLYTLTTQIQVSVSMTLEGIQGATNTVIDAAGAYYGIFGTGSNIVLNRLTVKNASKSGIYFGSTATVEDCRVINNGSAEQPGGGIHVCCYPVTVRRAEVAHNVGKHGGGLYGGGLLTLEYSVIHHNRADAGGGVWSSEAIIRNCTISRNEAKIGGGGFGYRFNARNSIIRGNIAQTGPDVVYRSASSGFTNVCAFPLLTGLDNFTDDPAFADADSGDFSLLPGSPCINAGLRSSWTTSGIDFAGSPAELFGLPDLGAVEFSNTTLRASLRSDAFRVSGARPVVFRALASGALTNGLTYSWDLNGDGSGDAYGAGLSSITQTYGSIGSALITVLVSNSAGETFAYATTNAFRIAPTSLYAAVTGGHVWPYTNWVTAATNLVDVLHAAGDGSVVYVSNGVFHTHETLVLSQAITVRGAGMASNTVVDGTGTGTVIEIAHVGARVEQLTLRGGGGREGGGVYFSREGGFLRDSIVVSNSLSMSSNSGGGGIMCMAGSSVSGCIIAHNSAGLGAGGGIAMHGGGVVSNCVIFGNDRCAVYCSEGACLNSILFSNTYAYVDNGSAFAAPGNGLLSDCIVRDHEGIAVALGYGGEAVNCLLLRNDIGIKCNVMGKIRHCTASGNTQYGYVVSVGTLLQNSISYPEGISVHCTLNICPTVEGSLIQVDPSFVNAAAEDFRLLPSSAAIDIGSTNANIKFDRMGIARPLDGDNDGTSLPDAGAHEYVHPLADSDGDGLLDTNEIAIGWNPACSGQTCVVSVPDPDPEPTNQPPAGPTMNAPLRADEAGGIVIRWESVTGEFYSVERTVELKAVPFSAIRSNVPGQHPLTAITDMTATAQGPYFYRVLKEAE